MNCAKGDYYWKVEALDTDSLVTESEVFKFVVGTITSVQENVIPVDYKLGQSFPNPFNPSTTITYDLPDESFVEISVYNMVGEKVADLIKGRESVYEKFNRGKS